MQKLLLIFSILLLSGKLTAQISSISPINEVNSSNHESAPFFSNTEEILFFSSNRSGNFDLYGIRFEQGNFTGEVLPINQTSLFENVIINSASNEISGDMQNNGKKIYFSSNRNGGFGDYDIYFVKNVKEEWKKSENLTDSFNSSAYDGEPTLSPDGRTMYFTSNREGGHGGYDIWYSKYDMFSETWTKPHNLDIVNTIGDETAPFLAPDGQTLFFASDSMMYNLGQGKDFYYIKKKNDKWSEIKHLDAPFNSAYDDNKLIFIRDGSLAIVSSNRNGNYDIFSVKTNPLFETPITIELFAMEKETQNPIPVNFTIKSGKKRLFGKKGEEAEAIILPKLFEENNYLDITIKAINPLFPPQEINLKLSKSDMGKKIPVKIIFSE